MLQINSNGSKWYGQKPDTIEKLLEVLNEYALDPTFEDYGNFVQREPHWLHKEAAEKYKGCTVINGNFATLSHVFNIITDEPDIIEVLEQAINKNKSTKEYKKHRKEYVESEHRKDKARFLFNKGKITQREMYDMMMGII
jgi:hypothetical protein